MKNRNKKKRKRNTQLIFVATQCWLKSTDNFEIFVWRCAEKVSVVFVEQVARARLEFVDSAFALILVGRHHFDLARALGDKYRFKVMFVPDQSRRAFVLRPAETQKHKQAPKFRKIRFRKCARQYEMEPSEQCAVLTSTVLCMENPTLSLAKSAFACTAHARTNKARKPKKRGFFFFFFFFLLFERTVCCGES